MLDKKAIAVICLFFILGSLSAQEIDKTLYTRMTLREAFIASYESSGEYFKVDVRFVRSFLWWTGERWEVARSVTSNA